MTESNNPVVWVSAAPMDSTRRRQFSVDIIENDGERGIEVLNRMTERKPLSLDELPKTFYSRTSQDNKKRPDIFMANDWWIVSEAFAEILMQHDLGNNQLAKVDLLKSNRKTPIEGSYYCLTLSEHKQSINLDLSTGTYKFGEQHWRLELTENRQHDQVALGRSALSGPDLWLEKDFYRAFFLSKRLATALREAKLTRFLSLYRCRVLADE
ncbi:MAG: hypothetical protein RIC14_16080 [Filomicrobium sp.]